MLRGMPSTPHSQEDAFEVQSVSGGQRYYFDTYDGQRFIPDDEGLVLSGPGEAKEEAIKALPHMARDGLARGDLREFVVEVHDEAGHKVWRAKLILVVEGPLGP